MAAATSRIDLSGDPPPPCWPSSLLVAASPAPQVRPPSPPLAAASPVPQVRIPLRPPQDLPGRPPHSSLRPRWRHKYEPPSPAPGSASLAGVTSPMPTLVLAPGRCQGLGWPSCCGSCGTTCRGCHSSSPLVSLPRQALPSPPGRALASPVSAPAGHRPGQRLSNKKKDRKWHIKTTSEKAQLVTQSW